MEPMQLPRPPSKTCSFWRKGACTKGAACTFAHEEIQKRVRDEDENGLDKRQKRDIAPEVRAALFKTKTCKYFPLGQCSKGEACPYIHSPSEQRVGPAPTATLTNLTNAYNPYPSYPGYSTPGYPQAAPTSTYNPYPNPTNPFNAYNMPSPYGTPLQRGPGLGVAPHQKFKTQPCKFYSNGNCSKGVACPYIHAHPAFGTPGVQPMRGKKFSGTPDPMYKFKTETCKFFAEGKCTKGAGCPYKHGDENVDGVTNSIESLVGDSQILTN